MIFVDGISFRSETNSSVLQGEARAVTGAGTLLTVRCEEGKLVIVPRETVDYIDVFEEQQLSMVAEKKARY